MPNPIINSSSPEPRARNRTPFQSPTQSPTLTPKPTTASEWTARQSVRSGSLRKVAPLAEAGGSLYRLLRFVAFYAALLVLVMYGLHTFTELEFQYDTLPAWLRVGSLGVLVAGVAVALVVWFRRNRA